MRPEDLLRLTRTVPFSPFRVDLTDRRAFDVLAPDMLLTTRATAVIGVSSAGSPPDTVARVVYTAPDRVRAAEPLPT